MKVKLSTNRQIAIILAITFLMLVTYVGLEQLNLFGNDIGILRSFNASRITRSMFLNTGILSTLSAFWLITQHKGKHKGIVAVGVIIFGSFVLLPFLILHLWDKPKKQKAL